MDFSKRGELTIIVFSLISDLLALVLFFNDLADDATESETAAQEKAELKKTIENLTTRLQALERIMEKLDTK